MCEVPSRPRTDRPSAPRRLTRASRRAPAASQPITSLSTRIIHDPFIYICAYTRLPRPGPQLKAEAVSNTTGDCTFSVPSRLDHSQLSKRRSFGATRAPCPFRRCLHKTQNIAKKRASSTARPTPNLELGSNPNTSPRCQPGSCCGARWSPKAAARPPGCSWYPDCPSPFLVRAGHEALRFCVGHTRTHTAPVPRISSGCEQRGVNRVWTGAGVKAGASAGVKAGVKAGEGG